MIKKIIWSPLAENDITIILEYLQDNWKAEVVNNFIDITDESISQIINNPKQFPLINKKAKIRKCILTKHNSLYYKIRNEYIDILRVFDNRQDPEKLKFK